VPRGSGRRRRLGCLTIGVGLIVLAATASQGRRLHSRVCQVPTLVEEQLALVISSLARSDANARRGETLSRWSAHGRVLPPHSHSLPQAERLAQARRRRPEATGYRRAGHAPDAIALDLRAITLLTRFVMASPLDPAGPEALFLLGDAYLRLRPVVPSPLGMERVLGTLWEEYPDSIWAARARRFWLEATGVSVG
jgi:hypothetical protein